ncbi:MAG TPA: DMT family transporter [Candidatus Methylomirabilis sp.]|nr:DMT family transporter [Candidatus Methylomirabilis sp.]
MHSENLRRGAAFMISSGLLFAAMGAMIKYIAAHLPNEMVVFFRSAMGLVALLPWIWRRGFGQLRTKRLHGHLTRGLAGLAAMYCYFYAIAHMPLAEATLLNYSTPLFVPFIAWLALKEKISHRLWAAIGLGFLGILLILKPGLSLFTPVSLIGVSAGVFAALAMTSIRELTRSEPTLRIVFYFSAVGTVVSAMPLAWSWQAPEPGLWMLLVGMGIVGSLGQLLLTRAYSYAPAAHVGPFSYSTVVFAAGVGWLFWGEVPDALSFVGAVLVCLAGILTIRIAGKRAIPLAEISNRR